MCCIRNFATFLELNYYERCLMHFLFIYLILLNRRDRMTDNKINVAIIHNDMILKYNFNIISY